MHKMFVSRTCPQCHTCQNILVIRDLYAKKKTPAKRAKIYDSNTCQTTRKQKAVGEGGGGGRSGVEVELRTF